MAIRKSWHEIFALHLVRVSILIIYTPGENHLMVIPFSKKNTAPRNPLKALPNSFRLRKIICLLAKDFTQRLRASKDDSLHVSNHVIANQSLVLHSFEPIFRTLERKFQKICVGVPSEPASILSIY